MTRPIKDIRRSELVGSKLPVRPAPVIQRPGRVHQTVALAGGHRARERRDQPAAVDLVGNVFISALTAVASVPMLLLVAAAIAIGLVINVLQDSAQAALTLSTDVLLTAAACREAITAAAPAHPATFAARS